MMINYYSNSLASSLSGHVAKSQIVIIIEYRPTGARKY